MVAALGTRSEAPARMNQPQDSDALALARHAAATWIQEALKQNFTLVRATALASERTWGGKTYSASTLESWYYLLRHQGFDALHRQPRKDKGSRKALSPEACQGLLEWRQKYPQLTIKVVVRQLVEKGIRQRPGLGGWNRRTWPQARSPSDSLPTSEWSLQLDACPSSVAERSGLLEANLPCPLADRATRDHEHI